MKKNALALFFLNIAFIEWSSFAKDLNSYIDKKERLIFAVSIPKCGTHLLDKCLMLLTKKKSFYSGVCNSITQEKIAIDPNKFFLKSHHSICTEKELAFITLHNMLGVFIYRDPRDQIISLIWYVKKTPSHPNYRYFIDKTFDELIYVCIDALPETYNDRLRWIDSQSVYTTTFEKLIGSKGGGSDNLQYRELINIASHLKIKLADDEIRAIMKKLFGGTWSFREGKIGAWKQHFTEDHKKYFKAHVNQLLIDLGYEQDADW